MSLIKSRTLRTSTLLNNSSKEEVTKYLVRVLLSLKPVHSTRMCLTVSGHGQLLWTSVWKDMQFSTRMGTVVDPGIFNGRGAAEDKAPRGRGAKGTEGGGVWGGGVPLPTGGGVWGGGF